MTGSSRDHDHTASGGRPQEAPSLALALLAVGDAARFTSGALFDEAYDKGCDGVDQMALLAVARSWSLFADNCTEMGLRLQEEEEA